VFAGGRRKFLRTQDTDPSCKNLRGDRIDNRNLIDEWHLQMRLLNVSHKYIWNLTAFDEFDPSEASCDHVLGLLAHSHMAYESSRARAAPAQEPSLAEMTAKAVRMLSRNPNGYFLLVEGGKIDHAHHDSVAKKALEEFVAFDEAIGEAKRLAGTEDTLITVTADHSHV
jgi:alkaline phosphatase